MCVVCVWFGACVVPLNSIPFNGHIVSIYVRTFAGWLLSRRIRIRIRSSLTLVCFAEVFLSFHTISFLCAWNIFRNGEEHGRDSKMVWSLLTNPISFCNKFHLEEMTITIWLQLSVCDATEVVESKWKIIIIIQATGRRHRRIVGRLEEP